MHTVRLSIIVVASPATLLFPVLCWTLRLFLWMPATKDLATELSPVMKEDTSNRLENSRTQKLRARHPNEYAIQTITKIWSQELKSHLRNITNVTCHNSVTPPKITKAMITGSTESKLNRISGKWLKWL